MIKLMAMREAILNIRGKSCTINNFGRISFDNPRFTATVSELTLLRLISKGLKLSKVAAHYGTTTGTILTMMTSLRTKNDFQTTTGLIRLGKELDVLRPFALEGIKTQVRILKGKTNTNQPLDITSELQALSEKALI